MSDQEAAFWQRSLFIASSVDLGTSSRLLAIVVATRALLDKLCGKFLDWGAGRLVEVSVLDHIVRIPWPSVDSLQSLVLLVVLYRLRVPTLRLSRRLGDIEKLDWLKRST